MPKKIGSVAVVGGGIGGMQAALDLADSGMKVYLIESKPGIGGVMSKLDKTFPTNDCAMCTMAPRLVEIARHKDIEIISHADIEKIDGKPGQLKVTLNKKARFIDVEKCTGCGTCTEYCPVRNVVQPMPVEEKEVVELAPDIKEKVIDIVRQHKNRKGPLMPILQEVSEYLKYFPQEVLKYISRETGYPLAHICRIATFYSGFSLKPIGKYVINVCMGTACYVRGAEKLLERFSDILEIGQNETTPDMLFTIKSVRCIGCCGLSPVATVGDDVYGKLQVKDIAGIIKKYKEKEKEQNHA
jgi:NADH:ubiquinone oxidoreductase subunit E/NAD-dependent dihydropyrimidine dehydrogenase PreA subunit